MDSAKRAWAETRALLPGMVLGVGLMLAVFRLLGRLDRTVVLGGIAGGLLAVGNFYAMALTAELAADRAAGQDPQGGRRLLQGLYPVRLLTLAAVLFLCAGSGRFHVLALALPLLFVRPVLMLYGGKGDGA